MFIVTTIQILILREYTDPYQWILPTSKKEVLIFENWDQELETKPWPYVKKWYSMYFNNNLEIKSNVPRYSDLIEIELNSEHQYEVFVNNKLVHVFYPSCLQSSFLQEINLDSPVMVRSIEIRAVGAAYERLPIYNTISEINVRNYN